NFLLEQNAMLMAHFLRRAFHDQHPRAIVHLKTTSAFASDDPDVAGGRPERGDFLKKRWNRDFRKSNQMRNGGRLNVVVSCCLNLPILRRNRIGEFAAEELKLDVVLLVIEADSGRE